jgi:hypothetical protein
MRLLRPLPPYRYVGSRQCNRNRGGTGLPKCGDHIFHGQIILTSTIDAPAVSAYMLEMSSRANGVVFRDPESHPLESSTGKLGARGTSDITATFRERCSTSRGSSLVLNGVSSAIYQTSQF